MSQKDSNHELAYTTKIKPLKYFSFLFFLCFGVLSLIFFIPILLLFGYLIIDGGHVVLYIMGIGFIPFLIGASIYLIRLFYHESKRRIVNNRYPSGYNLLENKLSFSKFDITKNKYTYGDIPYDAIQKCIISIHPEPIIHSRGTFRWYEYQAVTHIVYRENKTLQLYSTRSLDNTTHMDLLHTMQRHYVTLEIIPYNLARVPDEMLLNVILDDMKKEPLEHETDLEAYIIYGKHYVDPPPVYMDAYAEWLVERRGLVQQNLKPWHALATFILLSLFIAFSLTQENPDLLATVIAPYLALAIGYIFYIYTLKRATYWKTLIPFALTLVLYFFILYITGHEPFTFYTEPGAMATFANTTSEAVIGTVIGFFAGSYILYLVAKEAVREYWPAKFHEEIHKVIHSVGD